MPEIRIAVSEEQYQQLLQMAKEQGSSIQDIIRNKMFEQETIYTPAEAVRRALEKYKSGDRFTLTDLYPNEWNLERGVAGVFGRQTYKYISENYRDRIVYIGRNKQKRQAEYEII